MIAIVVVMVIIVILIVSNSNSVTITMIVVMMCIAEHVIRMEQKVCLGCHCWSLLTSLSASCLANRSCRTSSQASMEAPKPKPSTPIP